jgi:hypothetical protein
VVVLFFLYPDDGPGPTSAAMRDCRPYRCRERGITMTPMAARGWGRLGWAISAIATIALAAYMVSVGWSRANLIAGVGAFFVAVAGLALALAARQRAQMEQMEQRMCDMKAKRVVQEAHVSPPDKVIQSMARITARSVYQRIRAFTQVRAHNVGREGDRDES